MRQLLKITLNLVFLFGVIQINANTNSEKKEKVTQVKIEIETPQNSQDKYLKTIEFIKSKISLPYTASYTFKIQIQNCVLTTISSAEGTMNVSLKNLNPNMIEVENSGGSLFYYVVLHVTGNEKLVDAVNVHGAPYKYHKITVHCDSQDSANRIAKAFKFLIEYCGGEDEMY